MSQNKHETKTSVQPHASTNGSKVTGGGVTVTQTTPSSRTSATVHVSSGPTMFSGSVSKNVSNDTTITTGASVDTSGKYNVSAGVGFSW